jgi:tetratricopeptide (TPR) repeat protein
VFLVFAACVAAVVLLYRQNADLAWRLSELSSNSDRQAVQLQDNMNHLSDRVDGIAIAIGAEISSRRTGSHRDANRLQNQITRSIASLEGRVSGLAASIDFLRGSQAPQEREGPRAIAADQDLAVQKAIGSAQDLYRAARYMEAVRLLEPLLEKYPENKDAQLYLAASLFKANPGDTRNYARIEQGMKSIIKEQGENFMALSTMGALSMERTQWAEGLSWYSLAAVQQPENTEVLRSAGACALYSGDLSKAQGYFDRAASLGSSDPDLWYSAGVSYAATGDHAAAIERFLKCLALQPRHAKAQFAAGRSQHVVGNLDAAIDRLSSYVAVHRDFAALVELGDCYREKGAFAEAETSWQLAVAAIDPSESKKAHTVLPVYEKLVRSAWGRNDPAACKEYALAGMKMEAGPLLQAYLGTSYRALGEDAKGVAMLRRVQEVFPGTEAAQFARQSLDQAGQ